MWSVTGTAVDHLRQLAAAALMREESTLPGGQDADDESDRRRSTGAAVLILEVGVVQTDRAGTGPKLASVPQLLADLSHEAGPIVADTATPRRYPGCEILESWGRSGQAGFHTVASLMQRRHDREALPVTGGIHHTFET
jgi:hypothetical protein